MPPDTPVDINARFLTHPITGVQRYALEISRHLRHLLPGAVFVAPPHILHQEVARLLQVELVGRKSGHYWEQVELPGYLKRRGNPLLLNLANTAPLWYRRQVVTLHDMAFMVNPGWFSFPFRTYYRFLIPRIAHRSRRIITVSQSAKADAVEWLGVKPEKVEVVYNAVSSAFDGLSVATEAIADRFQFDFVLAVSSLDPRKNFSNLIRGFVSSKSTLPLKLVIVGKRQASFADPDLAQLVARHPEIVFAGYVTDQELAALYRKARVFVYPSLYEGFGIPNLEAMAAGCPVVTSAIAAHTEVCGDAACYVDPTEPALIAAGIQKVLGDESYRHLLVRRGEARCRQFSWEDSARQVARVVLHEQDHRQEAEVSR
ncbi:glycosyltransferase family 1 protein [soil metagenome]